MKKLLAIFTLIAFFAVSAYAAGPITFGGGVTDGDKGDVEVSGSGATWTVEAIGGSTPTANGKSLISAANYAAMKALLDLEIGTDVNAYSANLASYATATPSANTLSLLGAATYSAMRLLLDLEIGTDIQAYSAILTSIANAATSANKIYGINAAGVIGLYGNIQQDNSAAHIYDAANSTKMMKFDPSGGVGTMTLKNNMSATGTVNVPSDFTDTDSLLGKVTPATLTNKILTAPHIQGYEFVASQTTTLYATQAYGGRVNNFGQNAVATQTLPTAAYGMDIVFTMGTATSFSYGIAATPSILHYNGSTSVNAWIAAPAVGDYFVVYSFKTGTSTWAWILKNGQGTIATS